MADQLRPTTAAGSTTAVDPSAVDPAAVDPAAVDPAAVDPGAVLCATTWCVVRPQRDEYLVYNPRTDELHLLSPQGHYLYLLCDGLRTVAEIQDLLPSAGAAAVPGFLAGLVARGVLEPVGAP